MYETGIGADAAPIRQSMTKVTAADSMREEFVPTFWYVRSACISMYARTKCMWIYMNVYAYVYIHMCISI
jgi:hypothetical protein